MKPRQILILTPIAAVALLGAACDGGEAAAPSSTATVAATAPSTPTAAPEGTATDLPATAEPGRTAVVGGIVTYLEKIALPAEAVIKVRLLDVSLQDAPSVTLGEAIFQADNRQVPFEYVIQYDPDEVLPGGTYAIHAEIWIGSELWFTTDTHVPAITGDAAANPEVVLVRVLG